MTPLLFAAWERLSKDDFTRILKLASTIAFRYSVVGDLNTNALEPIYHQAAKAVLDGVAQNPAQVFERLKSIYVDDAKFEQDFALLAFDTGNQRKKLAKYILARLEADVSGRGCDPETDPGTIEHILPENPFDEWADDFPRQYWDEAVYRLGNLTLLDSASNRRVANRSYAEKLSAYGPSSYALTRNIAEMAPEHWTFDLLQMRQYKLARRAVHLWRSDFV
jgi:hypothetical protein